MATKKDKKKEKEKDKDKKTENTEQWREILRQEIDSVFEELDTINKELFDR